MARLRRSEMLPAPVLRGIIGQRQYLIDRATGLAQGALEGVDTSAFIESAGESGYVSVTVTIGSLTTEAVLHKVNAAQPPQHVLDAHQAQLARAQELMADWDRRIEAMTADLVSQGFEVEQSGETLIIRVAGAKADGQ